MFLIVHVQGMVACLLYLRSKGLGLHPAQGVLLGKTLCSHSAYQRTAGGMGTNLPLFQFELQ